ncbi:MAG TPA: DUF255 domain-containing protein, partial [Pseudolysinimonas sp.]|nr:DUF255 domain-containing protein [Pseudolysinimonas sp.]
RLAEAVSPYLRSHAGNPVDWWPWSEEAFAEAARRDVPVMVSIGYATCHWCHVMARETFSDPEVAAYLNENLVAIKVDREEHPEVDASFLAAASAFTPNLGWPLTAFTTPTGLTFFAGTYYPPQPTQGVPGFRQVVDAVLEAWRDKRDDVQAAGARVRDAVAASRASVAAGGVGPAEFDAAVARLESLEDSEFGGLGRAPKFPNTPVISFLLERGVRGDQTADAFARRTLATLAASGLRDPVEGGFFRYATRRDWTEPHYERMAYDNAQLLSAYTAVGDEPTAAGIAGFLLDVLRLPGGAFASAQDSESVIDGARSEGGYYARDAAGRTGLAPPALDEKVLTGLNGMGVGALAEAGVRFGRGDWVDAARTAADAVLTLHGDDAGIARASLGGRLSTAPATLEDLGGFAGGLLRLALATGEVRYASVARVLVEACRAADGSLVAPAGPDPVLAARGLASEADASDGALPSGRSLLADAALLLAALTGDEAHRRIAEDALAPALALAVEQPSAFGAALAVASRLAAPLEQVVVVAPAADDPLAAVAAGWRRGVRAVVTPAQSAEFAAEGFELFAGRALRDGSPAAYYCEHFVCALPVTTPEALAALLD